MKHVFSRLHYRQSGLGRRRPALLRQAAELRQGVRRAALRGLHGAGGRESQRARAHGHLHAYYKNTFCVEHLYMTPSNVKRPYTTLFSAKLPYMTLFRMSNTLI